MVGMILVMLASVVTMFVALIHAATSRIENQAIWILVIILGGPLGGLAYFIAKPYKSPAPDRRDGTV